MSSPPRETRARIMEAAIDLFSAKGYAATSMRDIARSAGINVASIYHHFNGKRVLLSAVLSEAERRAQAYIPQAAPLAAAVMHPGAEADLAALIWHPRRTEPDCRLLRLVLMLQYENAEAAALAKSVLSDKPRAVAKAVLESAMAAGKAPPMDADAVSRLVTAHLFDVFTRGLIENVDADEVNRRCEEAVRAAIRSFSSATAHWSNSADASAVGSEQADPAQR